MENLDEVKNDVIEIILIDADDVKDKFTLTSSEIITSLEETLNTYLTWITTVEKAQSIEEIKQVVAELPKSLKKDVEQYFKETKQI